MLLGAGALPQRDQGPAASLSSCLGNVWCAKPAREACACVCVCECVVCVCECVGVLTPGALFCCVVMLRHMERGGAWHEEDA